MTPIFETEEKIKTDSRVRGENSKTPTIGWSSSVHDFNHLSPEAHELLMRLNKLANSYPFNVLYRYRENLHDIR
jgi:hypothetical protein